MFAPESVNVPVPVLTIAPVPETTPANVVSAAPPEVSVAEPSVIEAAVSLVVDVAIEATVSLLPPRLNVALFETTNVDESLILLAAPSARVPAETVVAPL